MSKVSNSSPDANPCLHPPGYWRDFEYEDDFMDIEPEEKLERTPPKEKRCQACHGSGQDRDGADCIPCEGYGSVVVG